MLIKVYESESIVFLMKNKTTLMFIKSPKTLVDLHCINLYRVATCVAQKKANFSVGALNVTKFREWVGLILFKYSVYANILNVASIFLSITFLTDSISV